ncbi:MAG: tRNA (adenosine(37)-N6)-threonylcarbamoyltransferase complex ATPase subunit type 1 TsaE [Patescibacteria group bacterium]|nr:tRNA (adenosine(37)-N6)-threonylcarbamoyltransferase complex ATPase subunit type 1 TsaE [Patescibacteria group bacterium]
MKTITKTEKETIDFGKKLAKTLKGGDVLLFYGELGAGKTAMTKGIAEGLGIKNKITSPTFALMNVYKNTSIQMVSRERKKNPPKTNSPLTKIKKFVHIDTYRLKDEGELIEIGVEDYLGAPDTVCVVEWPEKLSELLKNKKIKKIKIEHQDNGRVIIV